MASYTENITGSLADFVVSAQLSNFCIQFLQSEFNIDELIIKFLHTLARISRQLATTVGNCCM